MEGSRYSFLRHTDVGSSLEDAYRFNLKECRFSVELVFLKGEDGPVKIQG